METIVEFMGKTYELVEGEFGCIKCDARQDCQGGPGGDLKDRCVDFDHYLKETTPTLKDGMIVRTRENGWFIKLGNRMVNRSRFFSIVYDENFRDEDGPEYDVMEIYSPGRFDDLNSDLEDSCGSRLWVRKEHTVTIEETPYVISEDTLTKLKEVIQES